jgi:hypothetical protein
MANKTIYEKHTPHIYRGYRDGKTCYICGRERSNHIHIKENNKKEK